MTTDMRSGDIIKSKRGHNWIVGAVIENGAPIDLAPGRHLLLVRDHDTGSGSELLLTLRPECDLRRGHQRNHFEIGYSSARYGSNSSVTLLKEDTLYFAVPAPAPTHPFIDTINGRMLAKAPSELGELFVGLQHDFDDGHSEHLVLRRWQFALLVKRDREGKPPIDFDALEQRLARPEEV
ncbi:hypothetical protein A9174_25640 [Mesorhizobium loti NZP2037]|nr:hypothetical protein [Mesorhizobium loti]ANN59765.1 hypothetical protein A9174_25640 [Mesorhizobium loti NZP2037]